MTEFVLSKSITESVSSLLINHLVYAPLIMLAHPFAATVLQWLTTAELLSTVALMYHPCHPLLHTCCLMLSLRVDLGQLSHGPS